MMRWSPAVLLVALLAVGGEARAQPEASAATEPAPAPTKVAVVVAGDADPALTDAAARVRGALAATATVLLPSDPELTSALAGAPAPGIDDGLDEVRALRRRLGLSAQGDREVLRSLGRSAGAVAVVVVERAPEPGLRVFDVGRRAFFADGLALADADEEAIGRFVVRRATAARAHVGERREVTPAASARAPESEEPAVAAAASEDGDRATNPRRRFLRRNIGYFAAGALLVGAGVFLLVDRQDDPAPILRIRPGGE